ncbi:MAG: response regulator, partial [Acidiferrobacteraceae bacterium]|nr:response regulator [Acidiferrobacteraceae bacterium]
MLRILLIEDDPEAARYVSRGLREAGHLADTADNGPDGLALAASESYDLLVIDRMLPAMDGLSVIANLRDLDNHTPVLILSALGDLEDRVTGLRAGGDDYLPKP